MIRSTIVCPIILGTISERVLPRDEASQARAYHWMAYLGLVHTGGKPTTARAVYYTF